MSAPDKERLALVLGGGGSKGALQVGVYRAMRELGLMPDLIVGASVGAVNGAFIAAGLSPEALAAGWARVAREDLFSFNWRILWRGLAARSLFSPAPLRRLLEGRLPVRRFGELPTPLALVTTHLTAGEPCVWERGDLIEAILASTAIPGLLPPIEGHDGVLHIDGSLADNFPVEIARERGAARVVVVNARTCDRCRKDSVGLTDVLGHAFSIAADCKLRSMEGNGLSESDVLIIQPDLCEQIQALDFSQSRRLIEAGYEWSLPRLREWSTSPGVSREMERQTETGRHRE